MKQGRKQHRGVARLCGTLLAAALVAGASAAAQDHGEHHAHDEPAGLLPERLGEVHFVHSCEASVSAPFDRAVALLHSFWFAAAIEAFRDVLAEDPQCAIAYWGIALSRWGNPFSSARTAEASAPAWEDVQRGLALNVRTQREREYLLAVGELHRGAAEVDQRTRLLRYERAMEELAENHPEDPEARIFYALALAAAAQPGDQTYARQLRAAEILEREFAARPEHPGVAHYLIHSYDVPPLAARGLEAARRYAEIAPSAPHALHMPSPIFTRVGEWEDSIASNVQSADAARHENLPNEVLHAYDYKIYAYLQTAQDQAARRVLEDMASYGTGNVFAVAAIPARHAIEREDWEAARELTVRPAPAAPQTEAITRFVRALGFARTGDPAAARREVAEIEALHAALVERNDEYWAEQVEIQRLGAQAWAAHAEGSTDEALILLRTAAQREDATEKAAVTPGPLKPAREQLGELLLELGRHGEALQEFERTLVREPNRFRAVYGAAHAARLGGDAATARAYFAQLLEISRAADTERAELREAREATS